MAVNLIEQIVLNEPNTNNLVEDKIVRTIGIYSTPGNKFFINKNNLPLIINPTGYFQLESENYPITSLVLGEDFSFSTPTIIDIVYENARRDNA